MCTVEIRIRKLLKDHFFGSSFWFVFFQAVEYHGWKLLKTTLLALSFCSLLWVLHSVAWFFEFLITTARVD